MSSPAEVAVHQSLVLALGDDRLEQDGARRLDHLDVLWLWVAFDPAPGRVVVHALREQRDQPTDAVVVGQHRQVQGQHAVAEGALCREEGLVVVGACGVELGHHDGPRHADGRALLPQHSGHAVDAVGGRDDEERGIGGAEASAEIADEVGVAGGVEEVDLDATVAQRCQAERDAALLPVLGLVEVGHGACRPRRVRRARSSRCWPATPRPRWSCRLRCDRRAPRFGCRPGLTAPRGRRTAGTTSRTTAFVCHRCPLSAFDRFDVVPTLLAPVASGK